jgi:hypothetical protein
VRKIISVLQQKKYASIITILHNMEDLRNMTLAIFIGKLVEFEMSCKMGQEEASSSSKGIALTCGEQKMMKGKQVETSSSSSSSSEDEDDDESSDDDQSSSSTSSLDEESIKLINKVEKMIQKLNVKGVPIQIQDFIFTNQRREQRKKGCGKKGTLLKFVQTSPHPRQRRCARLKPSHQSRHGMILQVKKKIITRGAATSTHHQALLMHALWHEVTKAHPPLVRLIEMMIKKNHQLMSSRN